MTFLYYFYLFEDSRKLLYDLKEDYFDFLSSITAEECFSIMTLLRANALHVTEWLESLEPKKELKPARTKTQHATNKKKIATQKPKRKKSPQKRNYERPEGQKFATEADSAGEMQEVPTTSSLRQNAVLQLQR